MSSPPTAALTSDDLVAGATLIVTGVVLGAVFVFADIPAYLRAIAVCLALLSIVATGINARHLTRTPAYNQDSR